MTRAKSMLYRVTIKGSVIIQYIRQVLFCLPAQERDGVHSSRQTAQPLLHLAAQHHPGGGGPYPGPQESAENQGEEAGTVHPLGTS